MKTAEPTFTPSVFYHPGITLDEKLHEMGIGIKELADLTQIPEQAIWAVTNGDASISPQMALALEKATHISAKAWIRSQHLYDDYILSLRTTVDYLERTRQWEQDEPRMVVAED